MAHALNRFLIDYGKLTREEIKVSRADNGIERSKRSREKAICLRKRQ